MDINTKKSFNEIETERGVITNKIVSGISENTKWIIILVIVNIGTYLYIKTYLPDTNFLFILIPSIIIFALIVMGKRTDEKFKPDWWYRITGIKMINIYISRLNVMGASNIPSGRPRITWSGTNSPTNPTLKVLGVEVVDEDTQLPAYLWMSFDKEGTCIEIAEGEYKGELYNVIGKDKELDK